MDRVNLSSSLEFSRIVYGMWRLADDSDTSIKHIDAKINSCLDQGITTFDQAAVYGLYTSEALFGKALKANPSLRDKMEIVTKCGIVVPSNKYPNIQVAQYDTSREHICASVDTSLINMSTDYIDLLLVHRPDPFVDHRDLGRALDDIVSSGKVRAIGVSNFKPWDWNLLQSGMKTQLATNQIEISLTAHEALTNGDLAFHQELATPVMAWSPLGGGGLMTGRSQLGLALDKVAADQGVGRAAVAVAWILAHPANIIPVMGTNNIERISKISDALKVKMDRDTWFYLYVAALGRDIP